MKEVLGVLGALLALAFVASLVIIATHWATATFDRQALEACVKACGARGISMAQGSTCSCKDSR